MSTETTELFDFQIENHISTMEHSLAQLNRIGDPITHLVAGFIRADLEHFKRTVQLRREAKLEQP